MPPPNEQKIDPLKPVEVPVFSCIVYVSKSATGEVQARVANLAGIETCGSSEREALSKIVPAFKQMVAELNSSGQAIPWIEPASPKLAGEQERLIPVHL